MTKETMTTTENDDPTLLKTIEVLEPKQGELQLTPTQPKKEERKEREVIVIKDNKSSIYNDTGRFEHVQRVATLLSKSDWVPSFYKNNVANCFIAIDLADQMDMSVMHLMHGTAMIEKRKKEAPDGYSLFWLGQTVIFLVNRSKKYKTDLNFDYSGDEFCKGPDGARIPNPEYTCTAWAIDSSGVRKEEPISTGKAMSIGSAAKNPNWKTIPKDMLTYRAASFFARKNCSEVLYGIPTFDEMIDVTPNITNVPEKKSDSKVDELNSKYFAKEEPENVDK